MTAQYPDAIYTPREIENRSGVVYDETDKKTFFAEDKTATDDEVVAIETALGLNPEGSDTDVADRLSRMQEEIDASGLPPKTISYLDPLITDAKYVRCVGSNLAIDENVDLYTVPTGRKAFVLPTARIYNPSAGSITYKFKLKKSASYYPISAPATLTTGTGTSTGMNNAGILLNAGESISIYCTTTAGLNVGIPVIEFDDSVPLYRKSIDDLSNGNNTLYTVPTAKTARIFNMLNTSSSVSVSNASGASRDYILYNVPSGGSAGSTNQFYPAQSVADNAIYNFVCPPTLATGDFIVINTNNGAGGQFAWLNVFEIDD